MQDRDWSSYTRGGHPVRNIILHPINETSGFYTGEVLRQTSWDRFTWTLAGQVYSNELSEFDLKWRVSTTAKVLWGDTGDSSLLKQIQDVLYRYPDHQVRLTYEILPYDLGPDDGELEESQ